MKDHDDEEVHDHIHLLPKGKLRVVLGPRRPDVREGIGVAKAGRSGEPAGPVEEGAEGVATSAHAPSLLEHCAEVEELEDRGFFSKHTRRTTSVQLEAGAYIIILYDFRYV